MKILITGAAGFVGKNLIAQLENIRDGKEKSSPLTDALIRQGKTPAEIEILPCTRSTGEEDLRQYCRDADFVVHLAAVNRTPDESQFMAGNAGFTETLLGMLEAAGNKAPLLLSSSIHAAADTPYGRSKLAGEQLVRDYGQRTGAPVLVYRLTNLFGKWCRPNYNSVVATFCHNIARGLDITINDPDVVLPLTYIDDVVEEMVRALAGQPTQAPTVPEVPAVSEAAADFYYVPVTHHVRLGDIAEMLYRFRDMRTSLEVPNTGDLFEKKLHATYLSHLPMENFRYSLKTNVDNRGSFTEIIRTADRGQFSVNISKPGITKGNHWHHTKNEKFLVVSGQGLIEMRQLGTDENGKPYPVFRFEVSGQNLDVVEMIPGYTHNIINMSDTEDLITIMWANEAFDPQRPDTYFEEV